MSKFNEIGEFLIFGLFLWSLITISSTSIVFLIQVLDIIHVLDDLILDLKYDLLPPKDNREHKPNGYNNGKFHYVLVVHFNCGHL